MSQPLSNFPLSISLRRLLPRLRRFELRSEALTPPPAGFGALQCILSRAAVRFQVLDLKGTPQGQRDAALALQIRQASPFDRTAHAVAFQSGRDDEALVWFWDAALVSERLSAAGIAERGTTFLPESLFYPPSTQPVRVIACLEGVEAQVWHEGNLLASAWWSTQPSHQAWQTFLRSAGQSANTPWPTPQSLERAEQPWLRVKSLSVAERFGSREGAVVLAMVLILSCASTWQIAHWLNVVEATEQATVALSDLEQRARPVQKARSAALDTATRVEQLRSLVPYPEPAVILAEVGKRLPKDGTYIKEWDYQNGKLKFVLAAPGKLTASTWVKTFQEAGWFKEVQAGSSREPSVLAIEMAVLPLATLNPELWSSEQKPAADKPIFSPTAPTKG